MYCGNFHPDSIYCGIDDCPNSLSSRAHRRRQARESHGHGYSPSAEDWDFKPRVIVKEMQGSVASDNPHAREDGLLDRQRRAWFERLERERVEVERRRRREAKAKEREKEKDKGAERLDGKKGGGEGGILERDDGDLQAGMASRLVDGGGNGGEDNGATGERPEFSVVVSTDGESNIKPELQPYSQHTYLRVNRRSMGMLRVVNISADDVSILEAEGKSPENQSIETSPSLQRNPSILTSPISFEVSSLLTSPGSEMAHEPKDTLRLQVHVPPPSPLSSPITVPSSDPPRQKCAPHLPNEILLRILTYAMDSVHGPEIDHSLPKHTPLANTHHTQIDADFEEISDLQCTLCPQLSLRNWALVSRAWYAASLPFLYGNLDLRNFTLPALTVDRPIPVPRPLSDTSFFQHLVDKDPDLIWAGKERDVGKVLVLDRPPRARGQCQYDYLSTMVLPADDTQIPSLKKEVEDLGGEVRWVGVSDGENHPEDRYILIYEYLEDPCYTPSRVRRAGRKLKGIARGQSVDHPSVPWERKKNMVKATINRPQSCVFPGRNHHNFFHEWNGTGLVQVNRYEQTLTSVRQWNPISEYLLNRVLLPLLRTLRESKAVAALVKRIQWPLLMYSSFEMTRVLIPSYYKFDKGGLVMEVVDPDADPDVEAGDVYTLILSTVMEIMKRCPNLVRVDGPVMLDFFLRGVMLNTGHLEKYELIEYASKGKKILGSEKVFRLLQSAYHVSAAKGFSTLPAYSAEQAGRSAENMESVGGRLSVGSSGSTNTVNTSTTVNTATTVTTTTTTTTQGRGGGGGTSGAGGGGSSTSSTTSRSSITKRTRLKLAQFEDWLDDQKTEEERRQNVRYKLQQILIGKLCVEFVEEVIPKMRCLSLDMTPLSMTYGNKFVRHRRTEYFDAPIAQELCDCSFNESAGDGSAVGEFLRGMVCRDGALAGLLGLKMGMGGNLVHLELAVSTRDEYPPLANCPYLLKQIQATFRAVFKPLDDDGDDSSAGGDVGRRGGAVDLLPNFTSLSVMGPYIAVFDQIPANKLKVIKVRQWTKLTPFVDYLKRSWERTRTRASDLHTPADCSTATTSTTTTTTTTTTTATITAVPSSALKSLTLDTVSDRFQVLKYHQLNTLPRTHQGILADVESPLILDLNTLHHILRYSPNLEELVLRRGRLSPDAYWKTGVYELYAEVLFDPDGETEDWLGGVPADLDREARETWPPVCRRLKSLAVFAWGRGMRRWMLEGMLGGREIEGGFDIDGGTLLPAQRKLQMFPALQRLEYASAESEAERNEVCRKYYTLEKCVEYDPDQCMFCGWQRGGGAAGGWGSEEVGMEREMARREDELVREVAGRLGVKVECHGGLEAFRIAFEEHM